MTTLCCTDTTSRPCTCLLHVSASCLTHVLPSRSTRHVTCKALLRVLRAAACRVCPYAIRIMGYIVRKLNAVPSTAPWLAVRLSYGMNGILLPMRNLPPLTSYMRWALRATQLPVGLVRPRILQGSFFTVAEHPHAPQVR